MDHEAMPTTTSAPFAATLAHAMGPDVASADVLAQLPQGLARFELGREIGRGGMVLQGVSQPDILSDAEKWRTFMTMGSGEALGHIPLGCTFVGLQAMLWAVARWRNERDAQQARHG